MSVEGTPNIGRIVYLAGPGSSGKSTFSKDLVASQGWTHIERDNILVRLLTGLLEKNFTQDLKFVKEHLAPDATLDDLYDVIYQNKKTDIHPQNLKQFHQVCKRMQTYLDKCEDTIDKKVVTQMYDDAATAAQLGKNVIIDDVSLINQYVKIRSKNLRLEGVDGEKAWKYRGIAIEQKLKYPKIENLMRNVIHRNQNPRDRRNPLIVLHQFANLFKAAPSGASGNLDTIQTKDLKKWIERAVKLNFFALNRSNHFVYESLQKMPDANNMATLKDRVVAFVDDEQKLEEYIQKLKQSADSPDPQESQQAIDMLVKWIDLADTIEKATEDIFRKMKIPAGATEVSLNFQSENGAQIEIITD